MPRSAESVWMFVILLCPLFLAEKNSLLGKKLNTTAAEVKA